MANNAIGAVTPLIVRSPQIKAKFRAYAKSNNLPENIYEDFGVYANYMIPKFKVGKGFYDWEWFHWYICKNYQEAIFGTGTLLSIEVGPQIGKSILTALFVTFVLGMSPNTNIVYATYNETKAADFTKRYVVKFMGDDKYKTIFPHIALKYELDKKDNSSSAAIQRKTSTMKDTEFTLSNAITKKNFNGGYRCFGISQGIHGIPADIFIIDDYVDKADSVRSENFRNRLREWFYNDLPSRLQDNSSIIAAICTRWYADDIIGMLHSTYYEDIVPDLQEAGIEPPTLNKVKIRAQYRTSDENPIEDPRTKDGENLWRVHTLKYSVAKKGAYYNCVFNCDTSDIEDKMQLKEEDFGYYYEEDMPKFGGRIILCMDGASTTGKDSDHTAIGAWRVFGRKRYLLKLWYIKLPVPKLMRFVEDLVTNEWKSYSMFLIEYANSGIPVCQHLQEKALKCTPLGFSGNALNDNIKSIKSKKDTATKSNSKMDRYLRMIPEFESSDKRILLPYNTNAEQSELIKKFLFQITTFTGHPGKEDDFVDMCSYLVNFTSKNIVSSSINSQQPNKQNKSSPMNYNLNKPQYFISR